MSETVKIWYKETVWMMHGNEYNYIVPNSPLKEGTIISTERWHWVKVINEDGQIETINMKQVYCVKHGRKKKVEQTGEKYPYLPIWLSKTKAFFSCCTIHVVFPILIFALFYGMTPNWKIFMIAYFTVGLFFNAWIFWSFLEYYKSFKLIMHYKNLDPNYRDKNG